MSMSLYTWRYQMHSYPYIYTIYIYIPYIYISAMISASDSSRVEIIVESLHERRIFFQGKLYIFFFLTRSPMVKGTWTRWNTDLLFRSCIVAFNDSLFYNLAMWRHANIMYLHCCVIISKNSCPRKLVQSIKFLEHPISNKCIHIDGLIQDCNIPIAKVLEILRSYTKPST